MSNNIIENDSSLNNINIKTFNQFFSDEYLVNNPIHSSELSKINKKEFLNKAFEEYKVKYSSSYEFIKKEYEKKREIDERNKEIERKQMEEKKEKIIEIVMRQTNYDYDISKEKLEECNYNYEMVIRQYVDKESSNSKSSIERNNNNNNNNKTNKSINQQIYSQIRNFMDYGAYQYEKRKQQSE